ncbi:MAG: bifunctional aspartate kinase/homoserine dehydrogenase I [Pseudomonadota bacterium]
MKARVYKFGGSSVADADHYRRVANICSAALGSPLIVVVSAMKGMTDALFALIELSESGQDYSADLEQLCNRQREAFTTLTGAVPPEVESDFADLADLLRGAALVRSADGPVRDTVSGMGELWSSRLLTAHLTQLDQDADWLDARRFIVVSEGEMGPNVDWTASREGLTSTLEDRRPAIWVMPGYVARTGRGRTTTLGRNGSDFSAAIVGRLMDADEIHIFTDVDGVMSADPRLVPDARVLSAISFDEALELAYFGAKVIHPQTLGPAIAADIPVRIRNTFAPEGAGTRIGLKDGDDFSIKGISAIDDVGLVNVEGGGMIGVPGTARRLFGALKRGNISVVMISQASSEHSICVGVAGSSLRSATALLQEEFEDELRQGLINTISSQPGHSVLAIVGDAMAGQPGIAARYFSALGAAGINVRAIAQGSSERNISTVIPQADVQRGVRAVHSAFYLSAQTLSVGVIGHGNVGGALLNQLHREVERLRAESSVDIRIRAIAGSRKMLLGDGRLELEAWKKQVEESGEATDLDVLADHVQTDHVPHAVLIDCTASDVVADLHHRWLGRGIHVITANKKAAAGDLDLYRQLLTASQLTGSRYLYETTVGAGLPVVQTLSDLRQTGDRVQMIEGIFSGTLAYLFNMYDGSRGFSALVREAWEKGYTEPDPRDDLTGTDVARKLVILAREIGMELNVKDLTVSSLVPAELEEATVDEFLAGLEQHDGALAARLEAANAANRRLRFVGRLTSDGKASVGLTEVEGDHPFAGIDLTDNVVRYVTDRYCDNPLIVRGPGAGPEVTAAGVFADLLRLGSMLGAPRVAPLRQIED